MRLSSSLLNFKGRKLCGFLYCDKHLSRFVLLYVVGVAWRVNGRPQLRTPWSHHRPIGGSSWKLVALTIRCLTKRINFHICNTSRVILAMGWNIHYLGHPSFKTFLQTFFSTRTGRTAHQSATVLQNTCFHANNCLLGGLVDTWPFRGF